MDEILVEEIITPDENYKYFCIMRHGYQKTILEDTVKFIDIVNKKEYLFKKDVLEMVLAEFKAKWDLVLEGQKPVYNPSLITERTIELDGLITN
jgi:hypothetical protein